MTLDVPILVNRHIVGGWQYVSEESGAYFSDETDVVESYKKIREALDWGEMRPREWFKEYSEFMPQKLQAFVDLLQI